MSAPSEALDRPLSDPSEATGLRRRVAVVRQWLPRGQMLPEHVWRRRHATIVWLVWLHAAGLFAFGLVQGRPLGQMLIDISPILVAAYLAGSEGLSMKLRSGAASFGLVTCSAVLVHLWDGVIEAHFHFFVMIGILTLYQDWVPFLIAIAYVVVHHGLMGVIAPRPSTTTRTRSPTRGSGRSSTAGSCWPPARRTSSPGARMRPSCCATRSPACPTGCCSSTA